MALLTVEQLLFVRLRVSLTNIGTMACLNYCIFQNLCECKSASWKCCCSCWS